MSMARTTRGAAPRSRKVKCFWFNPDGSPRSGGCRKGIDCAFIHPDDIEWDLVPDSRLPGPRTRTPPPRDLKLRLSSPHRERSPPPRRFFRDDTDTGRDRSRDRDRDKDRGSYHQRSSQDPKSPVVVTPKSLPERKPSTSQPRIATGSASGPTPKANETKAKSLVRTAGPPPFSADPRAPEPQKSEANTQPPLLPLPPMSAQIQKQPPPPFHAPPPMPPPPPASTLPPPPLPLPMAPPEPPNLPLDISSFLTAPVAELTLKEKQDLWAERIKLITESVQARLLHGKLDEEHKELQKLQHGGRTYIQSQEDLRRLDAQIAELEAQRDEKKKRMDDSIATLTHSRFWPMLPPETENTTERYKSLVDAVESLKATAQQVHSVLNALRESGTSDEAMDVDEDPAARPLKRKRLSVQKAAAHEEEDSGPSAAEVEEIKKQICDLEMVISNVENDMNAHDIELGEEIEQSFQMKIEELMDTATIFNQTAADAERLGLAEENVVGMNETIAELAVETEGLMKKAQETELQVTTLQQEIGTWDGQFAVWQQKMQDVIKARERSQNEITTLTAALNAYIQHPPSPPTSPRIPPIDEVLEDITEPLSHHMREQVKEMLETFRTQIEQAVQTHDAQVFPELSEKLAKVFRVMNALSDLMKRNHI